MRFLNKNVSIYLTSNTDGKIMGISVFNLIDKNQEAFVTTGYKNMGYAIALLEKDFDTKTTYADVRDIFETAKVRISEFYID